MINFLANRRASKNASAINMISQMSSKSGTTIAQGLQNKINHFLRVLLTIFFLLNCFEVLGRSSVMISLIIQMRINFVVLTANGSTRELTLNSTKSLIIESHSVWSSLCTLYTNDFGKGILSSQPQ